MYALVGIADDVGQVLMRIHILHTLSVVHIGVVRDRQRGLFIVRDAVCLLFGNLLAVFCVKIFCRHRGQRACRLRADGKRTWNNRCRHRQRLSR